MVTIKFFFFWNLDHNGHKSLFHIFSLAFSVPFPGFGSLVALNLMMFGLVFLFMGILSEYVGVIHEEIRQRPSFLVAELIGFESRD